MKPDSRPLPTPEQFAAVWQVLVVKGRQWLAERQAEERGTEGNGYDQTHDRIPAAHRSAGSG